MSEEKRKELSEFTIEEILDAASLIDRALANPLGLGSGRLRIEAKRGAMTLYQHLKTRDAVELVDHIWAAQDYLEIN